MFGRFVCDELLAGHEILVYSPHLDAKGKNENIKSAESIEEIGEKADFIIPCIPINKFEDTIKKLAPVVRRDTIIMDVCSVKEYPVKIMDDNLPAHTGKIASHPMFGPYSFLMRGSVSGFPMVMHNAGCDAQAYTMVKDHFAGLGLQISEITPNEHDKFAARSHFFSQLTKAAAERQKLRPTFIDTPAASMLFEAFNHMNISRELLMDMLIYNKYAKGVLNDTMSAIQGIKNEAGVDDE